jgi:hypothetical protein
MMRTDVVNIKTTPDFDPKRNPRDVYIGRYHPGKPFFPRSRWQNPYKEDLPNFKRDGTRAEVIEKYRRDILGEVAQRKTPPDLLARLPELKGKRLGCWCKPGACHGDLLAEWANKGMPSH